MNKLIVFDVDGTILDSVPFYIEVLSAYSRMNGLQDPCVQSLQAGYHDPDNYDFKWGLPLSAQRAHLEQATKLAFEWEICDDKTHHMRMYDGAHEAMKTFHTQGYTLALVTAKPELPLEKMITRHSLSDIISAYRSKDDVIRGAGRLKPAPDMLNDVMRELGFAPEETVMIGDTTMDIEMGLNAGTHTIAVTWGAHHPDLLIESGAHYIVDSGFSQVAETVQNIFGKGKEHVTNL